MTDRGGTGGCSHHVTVGVQVIRWSFSWCKLESERPVHLVGKSRLGSNRLMMIGDFKCRKHLQKIHLSASKGCSIITVLLLYVEYVYLSWYSEKKSRQLTTVTTVCNSVSASANTGARPMTKRKGRKRFDSVLSSVTARAKPALR